MGGNEGAAVVGNTDGSSDGRTVGSREGSREGRNEGFWVGLEEVGSGVVGDEDEGAIVGNMVGSDEVGAALVGDAVGDAVVGSVGVGARVTGTAVGIGVVGLKVVGNAVGLNVGGVDVGASVVGPKLGRRVGLAEVGERVGTAVLGFNEGNLVGNWEGNCDGSLLGANVLHCGLKREHSPQLAGSASEGQSTAPVRRQVVRPAATQIPLAGSRVRRGPTPIYWRASRYVSLVRFMIASDCTVPESLLLYCNWRRLSLVRRPMLLSMVPLSSGNV